MESREVQPGWTRSRRRRDLVYGAHLFLVAILGLSRVLRSTQAASSAALESFAASGFGRGLALLAMVAGMAALVVIVGLSLVERRDRKGLLLLVLLAAAVWQRARPDALDLVYAGAAVLLSASWFLRERGSDSSAPGSGTPPRG